MIEENCWLNNTFVKQLNLQGMINRVVNTEHLVDVVDMYGAATGMIIEIGEMLQCDTRWKEKVTGSKKPPVVNREQFKEELADVFIYFMNVLIYSGVNLEDFKNAVSKKQHKVFERYGYDK